MSNSPPTPREIEMWVPARLADFVGCEEVKEAFAEHIGADGNGTNMLIEGETGTGKTSMVEVYVRTRNCPFATDPMHGPCGQCEDCKGFDFSHRDEGIFAHLRLKVLNGGKITHFFHVNCYELNETGAKILRKDIGEKCQDRTIVYLDEVQYLAETACAGILLKPLRELNAVWLATGITTAGLSPMFVRRFATRCETVPPSGLALARFLRERCKDWDIKWDSLETFSLLAHRSNGITAECISVLARAAGKGRLLTRKLVVDHHFISGVRK